MKRLLVTGADGFVGRWLVRAARDLDYQVIAAVLPSTKPLAEWEANDQHRMPVATVAADLLDNESVQRLADLRPDAVVHLAAIASGAEARKNPRGAIAVNAGATTMLAGVLASFCRARFLFVSSGEVYGGGHATPITEFALPHPASPYAESKARAELSLHTVWKRTDLPIVIARAFPHTGPGQTATYVLPALASRLLEAKRTGAHVIRTGNLSPVRDFLDVRDVVRAYLMLLDHGVPGEIYNVASGTGYALSDCFATLSRLAGWEARAEPDAALLRPGDIPVLIGDATKLRQATGWAPTIPFEQTLQELIDAQAH